MFLQHLKSTGASHKCARKTINRDKQATTNQLLPLYIDPSIQAIHLSHKHLATNLQKESECAHTPHIRCQHGFFFHHHFRSCKQSSVYVFYLNSTIIIWRAIIFIAQYFTSISPPDRVDQQNVYMKVQKVIFKHCIPHTPVHTQKHGGPPSLPSRQKDWKHQDYLFLMKTQNVKKNFKKKRGHFKKCEKTTNKTTYPPPPTYLHTQASPLPPPPPPTHTHRHTHTHIHTKEESMDIL